MNEDELYILIMGSYFHDFGMCISEKDYRLLHDRVVTAEYMEMFPDAKDTDKIRDFHHVFSRELIHKYSALFEIPSEEHVHAIAQVLLGHRRVDLFDEAQYPSLYMMPNGNSVSLPYLAALIRLADELDIAIDRNILFNYEDYSHIPDFRKHFNIKHLEMERERFIMYIQHDEDPVVEEVIEKSIRKARETLDDCRRVTEEKTKFRITQKNIDVVYI